MFDPLLQDEFCRQYAATTVRTSQDYRALMSLDGTYGEQAEASIAALLLDVDLSIYASGAAAGAGMTLENLFCEASGLGMAGTGGVKRMILLLNRDSGWGSHYQGLRPP